MQSQLYDCSECGSPSAGYWHCRDNRRDNWHMVGKIAIILAAYGALMAVMWFWGK